MSLSTEEVDICNKAVSKLSGNTFTYAVQTGVVALKCIIHYEQTRNALLRSHDWPFARARATLKLDTKTPDFEWDNQFSLPEDYMRMRVLYRDDDNFQEDTPNRRCAIEGDKLLCDDDTYDLKYIKKVTDPNKFDPLFTEVLVLQLALKLLHPIAGTNTTALKKGLLEELDRLMPAVRTIDRQEMNTSGYSSWNMARYSATGVTNGSYPSV